MSAQIISPRVLVYSLKSRVRHSPGNSEFHLKITCVLMSPISLLLKEKGSLSNAFANHITASPSAYLILDKF